MRWARGGESRARGEDIAGGGGGGKRGRGVVVPRREVRAHVGRQGRGEVREDGGRRERRGGRGAEEGVEKGKHDPHLVKLLRQAA